jgi:hypothetical protein
VRVLLVRKWLTLLTKAKEPFIAGEVNEITKKKKKNPKEVANLRLLAIP